MTCGEGGLAKRTNEVRARICQRRFGLGHIHTRTIYVGKATSI